MKNTIVFCLEVDNEQSYGEVANFIYKCEQKLQINSDEAKRVMFNFFRENEIEGSKDWIKSIVNKKNSFHKINHPENIKDTPDYYEKVYCIWVNEKADIIDLSNLYLLKNYYKGLNIYILFPNCDNEKYYKISQFLYSVGMIDSKFYEDCFFIYNNQLKRAQKNNINFSRVFTPLQVINSENVQRFFQKCNNFEINDKGEIRYCNIENDDLLNGSFKILRDANKKSIEHIRNTQIWKQLDVLAFVLFCYILANQKEELSLSIIEQYAYQMQQYSNAIRQLSENIVFHSKSKNGVLAFRVHNKASKYVEDKYKTKISSCNFLEIFIGDFCGDNKGGNIAESFVHNLEDIEYKKLFKDIKPIDFFEHDNNKNTANIWKQYYRRPEHIGKHFGLRIFNTITTNYNGLFGAESHSSYERRAGECYYSYATYASHICMPGTRYHIVFPIENVQQAIKQQDLSLDSGIDISSKITEYINYTSEQSDLKFDIGVSLTQEIKNKYIDNLSINIQSILNSENKNIIYFSLNDALDNWGEVIAKAIVIALFLVKKDIVVVLYQCSDNLKKNFFDTLSIFYQNAEIEGMFYGRKVQIVLYTSGFEETVLDLSSAKSTNDINGYVSHMKCIASEQWIVNIPDYNIDLNQGAKKYIPCDVLGKVNINGKTQTIFEHYTEAILEKNIQMKEFGCQLEHTHMRLGSTIHIDKFYEAEILFGNKLFVSRFAFLLVKDMQDELNAISKITLYGYGTYSESVLVQMIEMISNLYSNKKDIDYIILEREEERRGFQHKDRIRYNKYFETKNDRIKYYQQRKVATVVLINSTLKTHMRLINLYKEENNIIQAEEDWLIKNYAVILVGSSKENQYWKLKKNEISLLKNNIKPLPQYFIQVDAEYREPSSCEQCFPQNPVAEIPLVEVNAASTIPNQAFGIIKKKEYEDIKVDYELIRSEQSKLECLRREFTYGHVHRNENHFLYYFKTENICIKEKDNIITSLKFWKNKQNLHEQTNRNNQYNIIVAPMHYSNAGFVEIVNNIVFDGNAILLRVDFDKEYRCNAYTKYSYLRNYIEQLHTLNSKAVVRVHYVDDAIISGRTFHRAKSLIHSILNIKEYHSSQIDINIFDKVFVLVDRNSQESRRQYVQNESWDYYSYITINISSLRNYGDSCVYCNLKKEADLLFRTASTRTIEMHWKEYAEKFTLYSLEEYNERSKTPDYDKQFRRLFCTHMSQLVLKEKYHGNDKVRAIYLILKLLNTDFETRSNDKFEFFLSYIKCISRPFLVFNKAVKEAIFDIMLIMIEAIVCNKELKMVSDEVKNEKSYFSTRIIVVEINRLNKNIIKNDDITVENKKCLVKLLMKQLTELKSNYIIRPEKMDAIFKFMSGENEAEFRKRYIALIDRLVGASSDTNKSIWLDKTICSSSLNYIDEDFKEWMILENTRAFRDGIEKLYQRIYGKDVVSNEFANVVDKRIGELVNVYNYEHALKIIGSFEEKCKEELDSYINDSEITDEKKYYINSKIEGMLNSLPALGNLNIKSFLSSLEKTTINWMDKLDCCKEEINREYENLSKISKKGELNNKFIECIEQNSDIYQFSNFYSILSEEGYIDSTSTLNEEGLDMLACCLKVMKLCRNNEKEIWKKVELLLVLFKIILRADSVQFVIENESDNNLSIWKQEIESTYNDIVGEINKKNPEIKLETIEVKGKRHHSVITETSGDENIISDATNEVEKMIEKLEQKNCNYIVDAAKGSVLWKMENNKKVWIYICKLGWKEKDRIIIAKEIRKIMMFYQELKMEIFNPGNDEFIKEIFQARKKLSIYNSHKVYTHTKDYSRDFLYKQALAYFNDNEKEKEKYSTNYPSYILKLLADLTISQCYRRGLNANSYKDDSGIRNALKWKELSRIISDKRSYIHCIAESDTVSIKLEVGEIDGEKNLLCRADPSSKHQMQLLLFALILNAAELNRGKRENSDIQQKKDCVIVKIYLKEDWLVVENESEDIVELDKIKQKLYRIPDSESDGISLWSVNSYIRQSINSLILAKLKDIKRDINKEQYDIDKIRRVREWIQELTSSKYDIQLDTYQNEDGKQYFQVKLPIFMEKYMLE